MMSIQNLSCDLFFLALSHCPPPCQHRHHHHHHPLSRPHPFWLLNSPHYPPAVPHPPPSQLLFSFVPVILASLSGQSLSTHCMHPHSLSHTHTPLNPPQLTLELQAKQKKVSGPITVKHPAMTKEKGFNVSHWLTTRKHTHTPLTPPQMILELQAKPKVSGPIAVKHRATTNDNVFNISHWLASRKHTRCCSSACGATNYTHTPLTPPTTDLGTTSQTESERPHHN